MSAIHSNSIGAEHLSPQPAGLTAARAYKLAVRFWFAFLIIPFVLFLYTIWALLLTDSRPAPMNGSHVWFIANMAYLAIAGPAAIAYRSHLFQQYWKGQGVSPRNYLLGMVAVWSALEIGGIAALVGCLVHHSLTPCIVPALVAFVLFTPLWPSGRALHRYTGGNTDDPAIYAEPR